MAADTPASSNAALIGRTKFKESDFTGWKKLDAGGFAIVYQGSNKNYGQVAIKAFNQAEEVSFDFREIDILLKHSNHKHIVHFYGLLVKDYSSSTCRGYVMEFMARGCLDRVVHNATISYGRKQVISWMRQISLGLGHLHGNGIIHRDIKPKNLLLGETLDVLKISDFGTARFIGGSAKTSITAGTGTSAYMAPEVIDGGAEMYSYSADIYSLAITLWEISRRKRLYPHIKTSFDLYIKVLGGERPPLGSSPISDEFDRLIERGWDNTPSNRPLASDYLKYAKSSGTSPNTSDSEISGPVDKTSTQHFPKLANSEILVNSKSSVAPPPNIQFLPTKLPQQRTPKDCDNNWTFNVPKTVAGLIIAKGGVNIKNYKNSYNVNVNVRDSEKNPNQCTVTINGPEASFEDVHTVCIEVWKSIVSTRECLKRQFNYQQGLVIDGFRFNQFEQLLFMEDYNVGLYKLGQSWKLRAFSQAELDTATTMLMNTNPFRQSEPVRQLARAYAMESGAPPQRAANTKPQKWNNRQRKGKKSGLYNPNTFVTPQKTFVATEDSLGKCLKKATNILLLGPSGIGKSTFLNAFANYLQFGANFQKAEANLRVCIRADYTLWMGPILGYTPITLLPTDGPDDNNESSANGVSKTQEARCYTFLYNTGTETKEIRVIDTPGLLDTEGIEKDRLNIARILKCAKQFPEIHAILFLLKPNEAKLAPALVFVLTELLKRFHHEAAKNILFCFPQSYKNNPCCDTIPTLRHFLKCTNDKHGVNIEMKNDSTLFHLDNFGFMYLGAKKFCNFVGNGKERQMAEERWKMSAETIECLLRTIAKLPAYRIQKTLEIQDNTNWIQAFSIQMADLSKQIISNQQKLFDKEEEIQRLLRENKSLEGHLTHEQTHFVKVLLDTSRICCYSDQCSFAYSADNRIPAICDDNCACYEGTEETGRELLHCKVFNKMWGTCTKCKCPLSAHRRMKHALEKETKQVINDDFNSARNANLTEQERAAKACQELKAEIQKTESTLERLRKNGAVFAAYVQQNSLLAENDSFDQYLKQCLQVARNNPYDATGIIQKLEEFNKRYNQEKSIYETGKMTGRGLVTIEEVREKMDELEHDELISKEVKKCRENLGIDEDSISEQVRLEIKTLFGSTN